MSGQKGPTGLLGLTWGEDAADGARKAGLVCDHWDPWIDPAFPPHREVPKLTRAVRDELRRAAATIGRTLDAIDMHPWRR